MTHFTRRATTRVLAGSLVLLAVLTLAAPLARADGVPPVTLQIREQEVGRFLAQWRVSQQIPPRGIPSPVLPESCRPVGERSVTERPGAWFLRQVYDCPDGIAGQAIGIDFPVLNATVSTILRIELLSGDRFAHSFAPAETTWEVPSITSGDARALYRTLRQGVIAGLSHFVRNGVHWALLAVLLLLAAASGAGRLAAFFAAGQIVGLVTQELTGFQLSAPLAEIGVAAAVVVLAREALRPTAERKQIGALFSCAGLAHGLGLATLVAPGAAAAGPDLLFYLLVVLGMDTVLLLGAAVGALLGRSARAHPSPDLNKPASPGLNKLVAYVAAAGAIALAIGLPASGTEAKAATTTMQLPDLPIPEGAGGSVASRRVAAQFPDAPVQSFITVAPFEVRHEILVRLRDLTGDLSLETDDTLAVEELDGVKQRLRDLLTERHSLTIDDSRIQPALTRVDFLTLDEQGVLPRTDPVAEPIDAAWVGLTNAYLTPSTPSRLSLTWRGLAERPLPATITDPEATRSEELTSRRPSIEWVNDLSEDPTPLVTSIAVEPARAWLPTLSLTLVALALAFLAWRRPRWQIASPLARLTLAAACITAPVGAVAVPLPGAIQSTPDARAAQRILSRLLPNVYRAFEFPTESTVYDRLALTTTGETLGDIYLEHRRSVELEERGGARARVEAVEVVAVDSVEAAEPGGFVADAVWTVGGTVTHFGHRHFRQNRYDARVTVVPSDGIWKIRTIEVFDEERLQ